MQTAVGVFGGEAHTDDVNVQAPDLMVEKVGKSGRPAITSLRGSLKMNGETNRP